jgi:predicted branched-subunit amino acid permease
VNISTENSELMSVRQSMVKGVQSSGGYFISTFLFGIMFGVAASASGLEQWQGLLMSGAVFSASAQFAALEFWQSPLPLGTIAMSVFLVSTRNILLGMSMTHHFDNHSTTRKILWLFILNDPGVVTAIRLDNNIDKLGYIAGYGITLMLSWLVSTWIGFNLSNIFSIADFGTMDFAGPLMLGIMMVLFSKGSGASPMPWIVSGIAALILFEMGLPAYLILPISVATGVASAIVIRQRSQSGKDKVGIKINKDD